MDVHLMGGFEKMDITDEQEMIKEMVRKLAKEKIESLVRKMHNVYYDMFSSSAEIGMEM